MKDETVVKIRGIFDRYRDSRDSINFRDWYVMLENDVVDVVESD